MEDKARAPRAHRNCRASAYARRSDQNFSFLYALAYIGRTAAHDISEMTRALTRLAKYATDYVDAFTPNISPEITDIDYELIRIDEHI